MLKRFLAYYRPHLKMFTADMLASLLISAIGMVYPILTNRLLNLYIPNKNVRAIVFVGLLLLGLYVIRMALRYFVQYYGHMIGMKMQATMRRDLFDRLEQLPVSFFDEHETGRIMSRMTSDLFEISELAHHGPENLIVCTIMIVGSFIYLCTIHVGLTLIIFACVPIMIAVSGTVRRKMKAAFAERRAANAEINAALENSITGIRVTKAFTNQKAETEKFEVGNQNFVKAGRSAYRAMATFFSTNGFITDVFNVLIIIAGGLFLYSGKINFGDYATFIVSVNLFINPVTTLVNFMEQYQNGVTGFARVLEILDQPPEQESPNAATLTVPAGKVEFKNVTFSYEKSGRPGHTLNCINLTVQPGKMLALVGPSGGGKTTLCHLLPRFYRPQQGQICIDGQNIAGVTLQSLRQSIGIVQQDVFLFNGTFRDNILYGRPTATDAEMIDAAKRADIHRYIESLPQGYNTPIGERGVKLSGGQKQRLSIARVFLKNPAILILDEATSALDNATELLIQQALSELCKGRTTIVVAHRLSTVRGADDIAVVQNGQIVQQGSHKQLLAQGGLYRELYEMQFREEPAAF